MKANFSNSNYSNISCNCMYLGYNAVLRLCVQLNRYDAKSHENKNYHSEYAYSDKNGNPTNSIRLIYNYHYALESLKANGKKEFVMITIQDLPLLLRGVNRINDYLTKPEYKDIFYYDEDKRLQVKSTDIVYVEGLSLGTKLSFELKVIKGYENNDLPGIRMYFNDNGIYSDIFANQFLGFAFYLNTTPMQVLAQSLINYIQRPELGTNRTISMATSLS